MFSRDSSRLVDCLVRVSLAFYWVTSNLTDLFMLRSTKPISLTGAPCRLFARYPLDNWSGTYSVLYRVLRLSETSHCGAPCIVPLALTKEEEMEMESAQ